MIFFKYHGTANDFIMIDNRTLFFPKENYDLIEKLCNRRTGIGADGLILLENVAEYDFKMVYYNADGKPSSMCGNGGRCIVAFAKELKIITGKTSFIAVDGLHEAEIINGEIALKMNDVDQINSIEGDFELNTGSPHYVNFRKNIDQINIIESAHSIRYNEEYKSAGINVNFAEPIAENTIKVRTYERGVEDETFSCGTGVVASAISFVKKNFSKSGKHEIAIETKGGNLKVSFETNNDGKVYNVWLKGPAEKVFQGNIEI